MLFSNVRSGPGIFFAFPDERQKALSRFNGNHKKLNAHVESRYNS
jgi:hypothetical protein